jgi:hypothetical protein
MHQLQASVQVLHFARRHYPLFGIARIGIVHLWLDSPALDPHLQSCPGVRSKKMLWTICVILLVLWALGLATSYTAGGLIHVLLVVGLVILLFRVLQGRRILG